MNILEQQQALESFSDDMLLEEAKAPTGTYPTFLIATEIERRRNVRNRYQSQQAAKGQSPSVLEQRIKEAEQGLASLPGFDPAKQQTPRSGVSGGMPGMPKFGTGITGISNTPEPKSSPVKGFAEGGIVGYAEGGRTKDPMDDPEYLRRAIRMLEERVNSIRAAMSGYEDLTGSSWDRGYMGAERWFGPGRNPDTPFPGSQGDLDRKQQYLAWRDSRLEDADRLIAQYKARLRTLEEAGPTGSEAYYGPRRGEPVLPTQIGRRPPTPPAPIAQQPSIQLPPAYVPQAASTGARDFYGPARTGVPTPAMIGTRPSAPLPPTSGRARRVGPMGEPSTGARDYYGLPSLGPPRPAQIGRRPEMPPPPTRPPMPLPPTAQGLSRADLFSGRPAVGRLPEATTVVPGVTTGPTVELPPPEREGGGFFDTGGPGWMIAPLSVGPLEGIQEWLQAQPKTPARDIMMAGASSPAAGIGTLHGLRTTRGMDYATPALGPTTGPTVELPPEVGTPEERAALEEIAASGPGAAGTTVSTSAAASGPGPQGLATFAEIREMMGDLGTPGPFNLSEGFDQLADEIRAAQGRLRRGERDDIAAMNAFRKSEKRATEEFVKMVEDRLKREEEPSSYEQKLIEGRQSEAQMKKDRRTLALAGLAEAIGQPPGGEAIGAGLGRTAREMMTLAEKQKLQAEEREQRISMLEDMREEKVFSLRTIKKQALRDSEWMGVENARYLQAETEKLDEKLRNTIKESLGARITEQQIEAQYGQIIANTAQAYWYAQANMYAAEQRAAAGGLENPLVKMLLDSIDTKVRTMDTWPPELRHMREDWMAQINEERKIVGRLLGLPDELLESAGPQDLAQILRNAVTNVREEGGP